MITEHDARLLQEEIERELREAEAEKEAGSLRCWECQNAVVSDGCTVSARLGGGFEAGYCSVLDVFIAPHDGPLDYSCDQYYEAGL